MTKTTSLKDWALAYAEAGLPVFPCCGKVPLTDNGCTDATIDPLVIKKFWTTCPDANIGLRCSGMFTVLDFDIKYDDEGSIICNGIEDRKRLARELGPLPLGPQAISGSGVGEHWCFATPKVTIPGQSRVGGKGIDIRTGNQYIIVAPSVHSETGQCYKWIRPLIESQNGRWAKVSLPQLPERWIDWLRKNTAKPKPQHTALRLDYQAVRDRIMANLKKCGRRPEQIMHGSFAEVKAKASGKWTAILEYLCPGIALVTDASNRWHICPLCRKSGKFRLFDNFDETGTCICYGCHDKGGDGISTVAWLFGVEPYQALVLVDLTFHIG